MAEENEDTVQEKSIEHSQDQVRDAFGLSENGGQNGSTQEMADRVLDNDNSGDEGGNDGIIPEGNVEDLDEDMPLSALGSGETSSESNTQESPPESEEDSETAAETGKKSEASAEQSALPEELTEDEEILNYLQENPEDAKDVLKGQKDLTQRAQAIQDVEGLAELRDFVAQDPGRQEAFVEFANELVDGKHDLDADLEVEEEIDIPEGVEGTEYEDYFKKQQEVVQQLAQKNNQLTKAVKQMTSQQAQNETSQLDMGQRNGQGPTDDQEIEKLREQEIDHYEQFLDDHPELLDESGEPTDELQEIHQTVKQAGGGLDWEQAYFAVLGEDIQQQKQKSAKEEQEANEVTSRTAPSTSGLDVSDEDTSTDEEPSHVDRFNNPNDPRSSLLKEVKRRSQ